MVNRNIFMSRRNARGIYAPVRAASKPATQIVEPVVPIADPADKISKPCSKCGQIKPMSKYYRDKRAKDGHKSACKACSK